MSDEAWTQISPSVARLFLATQNTATQNTALQ